MATTDLNDLCDEWLAVCSEAVASTDAGGISRAFVCQPEPAFDCLPQLTVHTTGTVEAPTSPPGALSEGQHVHLFAMRFVALFATVVRCAPTVDEKDGEVELPDPSVMAAAAAETNADLWAVLNFTRQRVRQGVLFASPSGKREVFLDAQVPVVVEGGGAGWVVPIRVELGGYSISS